MAKKNNSNVRIISVTMAFICIGLLSGVREDVSRAQKEDTYPRCDEKQLREHRAKKAERKEEQVPAEKCDCETIASVACERYRPKELPTPVVKSTPLPLPPVKYRTRLNIYPNKVPDSVGDTLRGVDNGSGMAADTPRNVQIGTERQNEERGYRNEDGTMSKNGFYQERRRAINNTYLNEKKNYEDLRTPLDNAIDHLKTNLEHAMCAGAGEDIQKKITDRIAAKEKESETLNTRWKKQKSYFETEAEKINLQEREAYLKEQAVEEAAQLADLNSSVEEQNARRTMGVLDEISRLENTSQYRELDAVINQVVQDNVSQARSQQLLGADSEKASARMRKIIEKRYAKLGKDCDKLRLLVSEILGVDRSAALQGLESLAAITACIDYQTAIARLDVAGFTYEARKCVSKERIVGVNQLEGTWLIEIIGVLSGSGSAEVTLAGGKWNASAKLEGGQIDQSGPAALVSGNGSCSLRLETAVATGKFMGQEISMPGVSGMLPIKIIPEACNIKMPPGK